MDQKPSIVRNVHYVSHGTPVQTDGTQVFESVCRAAIITDIDEETCNDPEQASIVGLCVLNPLGMFFCLASEQDEDGHAPGSWHWPERV